MAGQSEVREFAADTREEAIAKAARYFGVPEEEIDYNEVEDTPVSGLGTRSLVIAAPKGRLQMRTDRGGDGRRGGDRGREGRGRDRGERERGGRDRDRDRGPRGRDRGAERGGRSERDRGERGSGGRDRDRDSDRDSDRPRTPEEQELERMAHEAAQHVRDDGEPQLLPAMTSKERWVVHHALKEESGIRSQSEGDGPMRRVKILPA